MKKRIMKKRNKVYSEEMREKFKIHRENWRILEWISEALKIPYNTIKWWSQKLKKGDDLKDWRIWNSTKQKQFTDKELREYVENNENATLEEIWKHFKVTHVAIYLRLKAMKYSYKKKRWNIKKGTKKKERFFKKS